MASILGVGTATTDIIHYTDYYPAEDEEMRAVRQRICRGGNVCNTLVVLSQLGHRCAWAGSLADDYAAGIIREDLAQYRVDTGNARVYDKHATPLSCITLNTTNGSRTITHYRDLPEYPAADFDRVDITGLDWIHFEGRNVDDTRKMMHKVMSKPGDRPRMSLEVEKNRPGIDTLFELADVILFSHDYARKCGYEDTGKFLSEQQEQAGGSRILTCTRGASGAAAMDSRGDLLQVDAVTQAAVVDTVGAGDVFNAGFISALSAGETVSQALLFANSLAGRKCAQEGFDGLGKTTA